MIRGAQKTVVLLIGMRDNTCRERVLDALSRVRGVTDVDVSLVRGRAVVCHAGVCKAGELVRAAQRSGYGATLGNGGPDE